MSAKWVSRATQGGIFALPWGYLVAVTIGTALHRMGPVSTALHATSLGLVGLCLTLWIRAKTVDQEERGNAERRAIFVGLWPPMVWLIADTVQEFEKP